MKDYLASENARNKEHAQLYTNLVRKAFGECAVLVGHHITFEIGGDLSTENEIPSADTLMFDHSAMTAIFGNQAIGVMQRLASVPVCDRDNLLAEFMELNRVMEC